MMKRWSLVVAVLMGIAFLHASFQSCLGQTDTNLLAAGDWSEIVLDSDPHVTYALRGRLLLYDDQPAVARVYLELQNLSQGWGWSWPLEVCLDADLFGDIHFEMRDAQGKLISTQTVAIRGPKSTPYHVILPCDSTIRLRADLYLLGALSKPDELVVFVNGGYWSIPRNATNDFFLSATLVAPEVCSRLMDHSHVWHETLKLPKVKIPVKKQLR